jgi:uncharacterized protein (TIGR01244 family)
MTFAQLLAVLVIVMLGAVLAYRRLSTGAAVATAGNRRHLVPGVDVGGQVTPADVGALKAAGYRTLINMRPDGEGAGQPISEAMQAAAAGAGLGYAYLPTSAASMSDEVIDDLVRALGRADEPVLIYCRSGTRVARAWALAEASRAGGRDRQAIVDAVAQAGFKVDDLLPRIDARLAARSP